MAGKKQLPPAWNPEGGGQEPPESYAAAIKSGNRLEELKAMRQVLAAHIDNENTLARDLAALMRQAREISKEIEELEAVEAEQPKGKGHIYAVEDAEWSEEAI